MKTKLLLFLILLLFSFKNGQSQNVWVTPENATVNDEITIYFNDAYSFFWTDEESIVYLHAGVKTSDGTWQNVNNAFNSTPPDDSQKMTPYEGTQKWKKTITPKDYFSLAEGTTVTAINLKFRNQYATGGNNETNDFEIELIPASVCYTANDIISFNINGSPADINGNQISFQVDATADLTSLIPTISLSTNATISPASDVSQDFTNPVSYTVTAENGDTQTYTVTASQLSSAKNISHFSVDEFAATISDTNINLELPYNTSSDLTSLSPTIEISDLATISPASGAAQDFTDAVSYMLTAENGSTKTYLVNISIAAPPMVIVNPENPSSDQEISITFNAKGTALENADKIYLHYGAGTDSDKDAWIGNWGEDDEIGLMTATGKTNQWQFVFTPTVDFAELLAGEDINKLKFLFRSADGLLKEDNNGNNYTQALISAHIPYWIEISPENPKIDEDVTLTFYSDKAPNGTLENATDIYLHSWAVTEGPKETTANYEGQNTWGDNSQGKLTQVSDGKWQIIFNPADFFGISDPNENLFRIGLILRNADGSLVQKDEDDSDIYFEADPEFYIEPTHPTSSEKSIEQDEDFDISFNLSENASFEIFADETSIYSSASGTSYSMTYKFSEVGEHTITINANNGSSSKEKTIKVNVYSPVISEALPTWIPANTKGIVYHPDDDTKATLILHAPTQITYKSGTGEIYSTVDAPRKKVAYVLGDFNDWTVSESSKMKKTPDGNYFWLTLDNLESGKEYVFQYLIDGDVQIADPYTEKVSDPDDQYISSETYPDLIAYPSDKARDRASVLQTGQIDYEWSDSDFKMPATNELNVYELHVRDFTSEGNYNAAKEKLDYIEDLGVNCIHLMPVSEFEGNDSWGYNPNFYFAPDKAYGTKDDLKGFIEEAHRRGIAVINDLVLNHSFYSSPLAKMYWNSEDNKPMDLNPWYNADHNFENTAAQWGADFNHTSEHTQNLVDSILNFWINEYHFDGFRFDFTKGFSNTTYGSDSWGSTYDQQRIDILERMVKTMWNKHPNKVAIFEHLAEDSEDKVLANFGILMWGGNGITQKYEELSMGYNGDISSAYYSNKDFTYANLMSYMESHDEERQAFKALKYGRDIGDASIKNYREASEDELNVIIPRLKAATAFNLLLPGPRMIWQFGELAYEYSIDYNGRTGKKPARWDYFENDKRKDLYHFYANLLNLRNTYSLYQNEQTSDFDISGTAKRITLNGKDKDDAGFQLIAIGNFSDSQAWVTPYFGTDGDWYNYDTNDTLSVTNHEVYAVSLEAGEYRIYTSKALSKANLYAPQIVSNADLEMDENGSITLSKDWFTIQDTDNDLSIDYQFSLTDGDNYSISGQTINADNYFNGNINVTVKVSDGEFESENYTLPITINPIKYDLNIKVNDAEMTYGDALPDFSVTYGEFVNNQTADDLKGTLSFEVKDREISASGLSSSRYNISYTTGKLTVNKATPTVSIWPTASEITYGQSLNESILTAGTASVDGSFAFVYPSTVSDAGTQPVKVIFTPTDAENYNTLSENITVSVNKADAKVSVWPTASILTYGETLEQSTLTDGTASVDGNFAFADPLATPDAGTQTEEVIFTPSDAVNYNTLSENISVNVNKADAKVRIWPTASEITYGQSLNESILTGGTGDVDGSFAFVNPTTVPNAGTQTVEVIFTPTDAENYNILFENIDIKINKADPRVNTWPTASEITYGQSLNESILTDGTASVDGSFTFVDPLATPDAGTQTEEVIFNPTDAENYNTLSENIDIKINKADPRVNAWPTASEITYGQSLSESILTGGTASVDGNFAFADPLATPDAGTQTLEVIFTPTDAENYNTLSENISVSVNKADANVSVWPTASVMTYGQSLSESSLTGGTASVDGTFAFANPTSILDAGTQTIEVIFTPTDSDNYNSSSSNINISVNKADASVSAWPTASEITYGQSLNESNLTVGTASVDGTFAFTNPTSILDAGTQTIEVIFTPTDSDNYNSVSNNINISVNKADASVSAWPTASEITYGQSLSESTLTGGTASVDGTFAFTNPTSILDAGMQTVEVIFTPTDSDNYNSVSNNINISVNKEDASVSVWPTASEITYGQSLNESNLTGGTANVDGTFAFANSTSILDAGTQTVEVIFTPTDSDNYNSVSSNIDINVNKADQKITWNQEFEDLSINDVIVLDAQVNSDLKLTYNTDNENIAIVNEQTLYILASGNFNLLAKNKGNNNYNSIEKSIAINVSYVTGIEKLDEDQKQLIAYPNPVINKLTIKGLKDNESIKLYNASGQIILVDVADGNKKQLNLSHLKAGIYILRTQSGSTLKLLKQ